MNFRQAFLNELEKFAVDFESERGEFARYGDAAKEMAAAKKSGRHVSLKDFSGIANTDAGSVKDISDWHSKLQGYGRDALRRQKVIDSVKANQDQPAIVRVNKGQRELVAGNSRLSLRQAMGLPGKVYEYDAPGD